MKNIPFRSNSGSNLNRLMLSISPGKCTLLREQKVRHPRAGGSGHSGPHSDGGRGYSIDSLPPGWKQAGLRAVDRRSAAQTDNRPQPAGTAITGDAFGLQMEGHVSLTISNCPFLHHPERQIRGQKRECRDRPCPDKGRRRHSGFRQRLIAKTGTLTLSTDKDYPGIPRDLSIPSKYLDTVFFAEQNRKDDSPPSPPQPPDEGRFPPARRYSEHGFPEYHPAASGRLGQISCR